MSALLKPKLILTVGLPRSGKSTWAKESGYPIVSPDAIRLATHGRAFVASAEPIVWAIAKLMVSALFVAGHQTVVLDACNISIKRRAEWFSSDWDVEFELIHASANECIERAKSTGREDIIPVIERMAAQWEEPNANEQYERG